MGDLSTGKIFLVLSPQEQPSDCYDRPCNCALFNSVEPIAYWFALKTKLEHCSSHFKQICVSKLVMVFTVSFLVWLDDRGFFLLHECICAFKKKCYFGSAFHCMPHAQFAFLILNILKCTYWRERNTGLCANKTYKCVAWVRHAWWLEEDWWMWNQKTGILPPKMIVFKKTNQTHERLKMNAFNMDKTKQCAHFWHMLPLTKRQTDIKQ